MITPKITKCIVLKPHPKNNFLKVYFLYSSLYELNYNKSTVYWPLTIVQFNYQQKIQYLKHFKPSICFKIWNILRSILDTLSPAKTFLSLFIKSGFQSLSSRLQFVIIVGHIGELISCLYRSICFLATLTHSIQFT